MNTLWLYWSVISVTLLMFMWVYCIIYIIYVVIKGNPMFCDTQKKLKKLETCNFLLPTYLEHQNLPCGILKCWLLVGIFFKLLFMCLKWEKTFHTTRLQRVPLKVKSLIICKPRLKYCKTIFFTISHDSVTRVSPMCARACWNWGFWAATKWQNSTPTVRTGPGYVNLALNSVGIAPVWLSMGRGFEPNRKQQTFSVMIDTSRA